MDVQQVLQYIQTLFPGQLVLHSPQLAIILGKSEKALAHLIERGGLPFIPKKIGSRFCVDVFQVAEWLATDDSSATASDAALTPTKTIRKRTAKSLSQSQLKSSRQGHASKLMEMRLESANRLSRFALEHLAAMESAFWSELANDLLRLAGPYSPLKYAVLAVWVDVDKTPCNQVWDAPSFEDAVIEFCEIQAKLNPPCQVSILEDSVKVYTVSCSIESEGWRIDENSSPNVIEAFEGFLNSISA